MAAEVEKVAILYEKPSQSSSDEFDLVKLAKFLKRLSKTVSCTIFTTQKFCDEKATVATSKKWTKIVMFVRNADTLKKTVEQVRKNLDAETAVEMKIVVTAPANTKLAAPKDTIIRCESFEEVADWYPQILVFLFEREQRRDRLAVFIIDHEDDAEVEWYAVVKEACAKINKLCVWTGNLPRVPLNDQTVDTVIIVSGGEGEEVLAKNNNAALLLALAPLHNITFLVFTNNKRGNAVLATTEFRNKFKCPNPTIFKCKNNLELDYKTWTRLLQKMSIIDCEDVMTDNWSALAIIGIVLLVIIVVPLLIALFLLFGICIYVRPSAKIVPDG